MENKDVNEDGAYVKLLEYNNKEALIMDTGVSIKKITKVKKFLRVGTQDCKQVITIDKSGGFINL